ncbi:hypothetical protein [Jeongeupia naejangsanensis]|uniref:Uncharacterized protein n=1 Tax=Jeongeupia naejangsanensis TaxID=613195 RepID=A0ABS2BPL9_9NEIS|nr:hypothetical protein [Jeongeupia naejangsanensis]MBM3117572.1 hypothetical protein [Jeongeupia naejangsanensis]
MQLAEVDAASPAVVNRAAPELVVDTQVLQLASHTDTPAAPAIAPNADRIVLADAARIDPAQLTEIRAGADVGGGLSVAFAIERTLSIDGQVLAATTFKWSNMPSADGISASVTTALAGGLPAASPAGGVAQVVVPLPTGAAISVGANAATTPGGAAPTAVTLISVPNNLMPVQVIQNSADHRLIQSTTVVSVSTSSFSQALGNRVLDSLNSGLVRGIR